MSSGARVLMLSQRRLMPLVSRCLSYEIEDVIRRVDAVDLVAPAYRQLGIQVVQPFALAQVLLNRLGQMTKQLEELDRRQDLSKLAELKKQLAWLEEKLEDQDRHAESR